MFYSIENTLSILPQICLIVLGACLLLGELREREPQNASDLITDREGRSTAAGRRNEFTLPPGEGVGCSAGHDRFYIVQREEELFQVYIAKGNAPVSALRRDRFGRYFMIRCGGFREAMQIIRDMHEAEAECKGHYEEN